jgi:pimeloyl-ACP methyl ester carboxylesterase
MSGVLANESASIAGRPARDVLRAADVRTAALVEADPGLDPDDLLAGLPRDLWGALVLQVIGHQLSLAGKRDPLVPPTNAEYLHERLPHSRLALLDTGHFAWEDGAEQ